MLFFLDQLSPHCPAGGRKEDSLYTVGGTHLGGRVATPEGPLHSTGLHSHLDGSVKGNPSFWAEARNKGGVDTEPLWASVKC